MEVWVIIDAFDKGADLEIWINEWTATKRYNALCEKSSYPDQFSLVRIDVNHINPLFEEMIYS